MTLTFVCRAFEVTSTMYVTFAGEYLGNR